MKAAFPLLVTTGFFLMTLPYSGQAQTMINLELGNNVSVSGTDSVGAVPGVGWQEVSGFPNFTNVNLDFDDGSSSGATATLTGSNGNRTSLVNTAVNTPDSIMFERGFRIDDTPNSEMSFSGLPTTGDFAAGYDVYFYFDYDAASVDDTATLGASDGTTTFYHSNNPNTTGSLFTGSYIQTTSTDSLNPSAIGNYVLFSGLSGASQTFSFDIDVDNTYLITGAQFVAVPEPSTAGLVSIALLGLLARRRYRDQPHS